MIRYDRALIFAVFSLVFVYPAKAEPMRIVSFYEVRQTAKAPVFSGLMDDPVWETANRNIDYYEYFKPNPGPGTTRTEFRMLYDDKGIYLGIINYDSNLDKLVVKHITGDDDDLWKDDCAEIYFDSEGKGIGFIKFVVTSLGVQGDMKRVDAAITLNSWSGNEWRVVVGKRSDSWIIEAFFPWVDLDKKAVPGDVWRFCHTRYSYSSGIFQGVTSSPGGSYTNPDKFGYIYFCKKDKLGLSDISDIIVKSVTPPWSFLAGEDIIICDPSGERKILRAQTMAQEEVKVLRNALRRTDEEVSKLGVAGGLMPDAELEAVRKESAAIPEKIPDAITAMAVLKKIAELKHRLDAVYWEVRIRQLADL